jgi:amino acid adenylation domain-containing protein
MQNRYTAIFIGNHIELIFFMEEWRVNNKILTIISDNENIKAWAASPYNNIPCHSYAILNDNTPQKTLSLENKPDYLFSIFNLRILPRTILDLAEQAAINFHTAPIKEHAGVYGTSWAIQDVDKTKYSFSWHSMHAGVDEYISNQVIDSTEISINDDTTAESLEIECIKEAKRTFTEKVINNLSTFSKTSQSPPQQAKIKRFIDKLPGNGLIDWGNQTARAICRLHNAMVLSRNIPNRLGLTKILIGEYFYYPASIKISKTPVNTEKPDVLTVFTKDGGAVDIEQLRNYRGDKVSIKSVKQKYLLPPPSSLIECLQGGFAKNTERDKNIYENESYWVKILEHVQPDSHILTFHRGSKPTLDKTISPEILAAHSFESNTDYLIILSAIYYHLYSISQLEHLVVGYTDDDIKNSIDKELKNYFARILPLHFDLQNFFEFTDKTFDSLVNSLQKTVISMKSKKTFPQDIILRYPSIKYVDLNYSIIINVTQNISDESMEKYSKKIKPGYPALLFFLSNTGYRLILNPGAIVESEREDFLYVARNLCDDIDDIIKNHSLDASHITKALFIESAAIKTREQKLLAKQLTLHELVQDEKSNLSKTAITTLYDQDTSYNISFEELFNQSDSMIAIIKKYKIQHNEVVLVNFKSPIKAITTILAILKAGGAYIPLADNIENSSQYLENIMRNAQARFIFTENAMLSNKIPKGMTLINFDNITPQVNIEKKHHLNNFSLQNLAYLIYTSGSTGAGKGVKVSHQNIVYSTLARMSYYGTDYDSNILTLTAPSFDASVGIIFWSLAIRANLFLPSEKQRNDYKSLFKILFKNKITHLIATPRQYIQLLKNAEKTSEKTFLKTVILGGENWDNSLLNQHRSIFPDADIYNEYGPTECTVWATVAKIYSKNNPQSSNSVRIFLGNPISERVKLFILDRNRQSLPQGIAGELHIAGPTVSRGYRNNEALNDRHFIQLQGDPPSLTYRTGDIVRMTHDHKLLFISRNDNQIKFNGHLIDISAIESDIKNIISNSYDVKNITLIKSDTKEILYIFILLNLNDILISVDDNSNYKTLQLKIELSMLISDNIPRYIFPFSALLIEKLPYLISGKIDKKTLLGNAQNKVKSQSISGSLLESSNKIKNLYKKLLHLPENVVLEGSHYPTSDFAMSSLQFIEATCELAKTYSLSDQNANLILSQPTIDAQAEFLDYLMKQPNLVNTVLLTGATGFLGTHILFDLLNSTDSIVYCLLHKKPEKDPEINLEIRRIGENFKKLGLKNLAEQFAHRIKYLFGDIAKEKFWLNPDEYRNLAKKVTSIYHCASDVNHLKNINQLKENYQSAYHIIKFAKSNVKSFKKILYISTLSTAFHSEEKSGYVDSKRKAEEIFIYARRDNKLDITIYRPGWLSFNRYGRFLNDKTDEFICLIKTCLKMKIYPGIDENTDLDVDIPITQVDSFSLGIIKREHDAKQLKDSSTELNFAQKIKWKLIISTINAQLKPADKMRRIAADSWSKIIREKGIKSPIQSFYNIYKSGIGLLRENNLNEVITFYFDNNNALTQTANNNSESDLDHWHKQWKIYFDMNLQISESGKQIEILSAGDYEEIKAFIDSLDPERIYETLTSLEKDKENEENKSAFEFIIQNQNVNMNSKTKQEAIEYICDKIQDKGKLSLLINNNKNRLESTPLYEATFYNLADVVDYLILKNAKPDLFTKESFTPLLLTCWLGNVQIFLSLLNYLKTSPATLNTVLTTENKSGEVCLHRAITANSATITKALMYEIYQLDYGARLLILFKNNEKSSKKPSDNPLLHYAASRGDKDIIDVIINALISYNSLTKILIYPNNNGRLFLSFFTPKPLTYAHTDDKAYNIKLKNEIINKHLKLLLKHTKWNFPDSVWKSVYKEMLAEIEVYERYFFTAENTGKSIDNINNKEFRKFHQNGLNAVLSTFKITRETFLTRLADTDKNDETGHIKFHYCVMLGLYHLVKDIIGFLANDKEKLRKLLNFKILLTNADFLNDHDNTPLHLAVRENYNFIYKSPYKSVITYPSYELVKLLIENGAITNSVNDKKITPLYEVIFSGIYTESYYSHFTPTGKYQIDSIALFKTLKFTWNDLYHSVSDEGFTLLMVACIRNCAVIAEFILYEIEKEIPNHYKTNIDIEDNPNEDNLLVEYVNRQNDKGLSALHLAVRSRNLNLTHLLLSKGANVSLTDTIYYKQALHMAVEGIRTIEDLAIVQLLVAWGAHVAAMLNSGRNAADLLNVSVSTPELGVQLSNILATTQQTNPAYKPERSLHDYSFFKMREENNQKIPPQKTGMVRRTGYYSS